MTVTPQTNATLEEIAEELLRHETFVVCGHFNPDGDCLGSTLGTAAMLRSLGKTVYALLADDEPIDPSFEFLPGSDTLVHASGFDGDFDVFIMVDAPGDARIGKAAADVRSRTSLTITLDHHAAPERASDLSYTDPDCAATTLIVWKLAHHVGIGFTGGEAKDLATCCYAGLLTDTGRFMFQNTNVECFESAAEMLGCGVDPAEVSRNLFQERSPQSIEADGIAAEHMRMIAHGKAVISWISLADMERIGATTADTENTIGVIRSIRGVNVACMLKERQGSIRGSFRSKDGTDVAAIASEFGGGGHKAAAGFSLECPLEEAIEVVVKRLEELLS